MFCAPPGAAEGAAATCTVRVLCASRGAALDLGHLAASLTHSTRRSEVVAGWRTWLRARSDAAAAMRAVRVPAGGV